MYVRMYICSMYESMYVRVYVHIVVLLENGFTTSLLCYFLLTLLKYNRNTFFSHCCVKTQSPQQ